jgi:hypothetical protein
VTVGKAALRQTAEAEGTKEARRNLWERLITDHKVFMEDVVEEEQRKWKRETKKIEHDLKEGDWSSLWKRNRSKRPHPQDTIPKSYTGANNKHLRKRDEVLEHIRREAHAIAEPEDSPKARRWTSDSSRGSTKKWTKCRRKPTKQTTGYRQ